MGGAKRITFLARALTPGGAERQLVVLANGLAERGHAVTVVTFYPGGALAADLSSSVRSMTLAKRHRYDLVGPFGGLRRLLRDEPPDILHGYLTVPNLLTLLAPRRPAGPRLVWGLRASDMRMEHYDGLSRATYRLEGRLGGLPDLAIVNSNKGRDVAIARGFPADRLAVVPNGIDLDRFRPDPVRRTEGRRALLVPPDAVVIGHVARLDPMKDHDTFLHAVQILRRERADVFAVCATVGGPAALAELEIRAARLGLSAGLRVVDGTRGIEALFPAFDVFCSSSRFGEGFPNVVAEAMACGVPAAVTDVGDASFLVGEAGVVAPPAQPSQLAAALSRLIEAGSAQLGAKARARAEEFSIDRMVSRTEALLAALTGSA